MRDARTNGQHADATTELERLRSLTCIKWTLYGEDVLPAWVADMDLPAAPVVADAVRALVDRCDFGYNFAAHARLPEAFASWQERRHGWRPKPSMLHVFTEVMQVVESVLWLHTAPGDGVVLFTPVYSPFFGAITSIGRNVVDCPLDPDGWRIDAGRLESVIDARTRVILMSNPHNPTGRVFDAGELEAIRAVAEAHDLLVISDEIWGDLTHPGHTHVPFASLGTAAESLSVTAGAASKAFNIAGLRCAVAHVGHAGVADALSKLPRHLLGSIGSPGAEATLAAWTDGEPWLEQTRTHLTAARDHLAERLAAELPGVRFDLPEATYLAWLDFRDLGLGADPAAWLRKEARVALSPGADFGRAGEGFARLNFATSIGILDEIIDRIVAAFAAR